MQARPTLATGRNGAAYRCLRAMVETHNLDFPETGPIRFRGESAEFEPEGGFEAFVLTNRRRRSLTDWFRRETPVIRFANGASPEPNELYELPRTLDRRPFDSDRIELIVWSGVNIRKESQTDAKHAASIQGRVIDTVLDPAHDPHFEIVFDDDGTGEAADIVC